MFIWFTNELSAVTAVFNIVDGHSHKTGRAALCWFLACGATDSLFGLLTPMWLLDLWTFHRYWKCFLIIING